MEHPRVNEKPDLRDVIHTAEFWHTQDNGSYRASGTLTDRTDACLYTRDEFAAIDPRLVHVLSERAKIFSGKWLQIALEYWGRKQVKLPVKIKDVVSNDTFMEVRRVCDISWDDQTNEVTIVYLAYELRTTESGFSYPVSHIPVTTTYDRAILDYAIPGWQERFVVGQALGLDFEGLTHLVLALDDSKPGSQVELSDVDVSF